MSDRAPFSLWKIARRRFASYINGGITAYDRIFLSSMACSCSPSIISSKSASDFIREPTRLKRSLSSRCLRSSVNTFSKNSRFLASRALRLALDSDFSTRFSHSADIWAYLSTSPVLYTYRSCLTFFKCSNKRDLIVV